MTNGKMIKELRLAKKMSLDALARAVGVTKSTVYKWEEGGIRNMTQDNIIALAEALDVAPSVLMGTDDMTEDPDIADENFRLIARCGRRISPEQRETAVKVLRALFPEGFDEPDEADAKAPAED